jgi:SOS-response transcriptional repressor LexA
MLTALQFRVAEFVHEYLCENGFPPTNCEIAEETGVHYGNVPSTLWTLERKRVIRREKVRCAYRVVAVSLPDGRSSSADEII